MDKNKHVEELTKICECIKQKNPDLDLPFFRSYVMEMFVRYCQTKEYNPTPLEVKRGCIQLPGNGDQITIACVYICADLSKYSISYHDLYSISHVDRNTIRKCERDIRETLYL